MAYEVVLNEDTKEIIVHSDVCDDLIKTKENFEFNNKAFYVTFNFFSEVEEFIDAHKEYKIVECEFCKPRENQEVLDEEYDDFYEEFDEDDDIDSTRCDLF